MLLHNRCCFFPIKLNLIIVSRFLSYDQKKISYEVKNLALFYLK